MVLNDPGLIHAGSALVLHCPTAHVSCRFAELREARTGARARSRRDTHKALKTSDVAAVHVVPGKAMCVETSESGRRASSVTGARLAKEHFLRRTF